MNRNLNPVGRNRTDLKDLALLRRWETRTLSLTPYPELECLGARDCVFVLTLSARIDPGWTQPCRHDRGVRCHAVGYQM